MIINDRLSGRVGWSAHPILKVKEQRMHLCFRTHLCTTILPTYLSGIR